MGDVDLGRKFLRSSWESLGKDEERKRERCSRGSRSSCGNICNRMEDRFEGGARIEGAQDMCQLFTGTDEIESVNSFWNRRVHQDISCRVVEVSPPRQEDGSPFRTRVE